MSRAEQALEQIRGVLAGRQYSNVLNEQEATAITAILALYDQAVARRPEPGRG